MIAGIGAFVLNDALVKHETARISVAQIIFVRGIFATTFLVLVALAMRTRLELREMMRPRVLSRAGLDALASVTFITSLAHLPLANATAINAATPLILSVMAVFVLREHVSFDRWTAIVCGFAGVMLIVQPSGDGFNSWSLLCVLATLLSSCRDFTTRLIDRSVSPVTVAISNAAVVMLLAGAWLHFKVWFPLSALDVLVLAAAGACMAAGYLLITIALRSGAISMVVPFRYTGLIFASVFGFLMWGELPNVIACLGMALLVGAGVYLTRRT